MPSFEKAREQLRKQREIREKKVSLRGGESKEIKKLLETSRVVFQRLRETSEGKKNEEEIRKYAKRLGIESAELIVNFRDGLIYTLKKAYKLGLIKTEEDIEAIIGAYVLHFRSTLRYFLRKKELKKEKEEPRIILEIAKRGSLISPRILDELKRKYPNVEDWMIKHFVVYYSEPEEALKNALTKIKELQEKYPNVEDWMIKRFVVHYSKPEEALEKALRQFERLRQNYPEDKVEDRIIKYFVVHNPKDPEKALKNALTKIEELQKIYPDVDKKMIKIICVFYENPEKVLKEALEDPKKMKELEENINRFKYLYHIT